MPEVHRCAWAGKPGTLMCEYHDNEWGSPVRDEQKLFEFLVLESFQAGLSWACILNKREAFRAAFDGFDPRKVAGYGEEKVAELLANAAIVRSRGKILAAIGNAKIFLEIRAERGGFADYLWGFTGGETIAHSSAKFPAHTPLSDAISRDLKRRGMKYMGTIIVYSLLQAVGVVNDHEDGCFRR